MTPEPNADQAAYWNAARHWIDDQEGHDEMLAPLGLLAIDALAPSPGERVLDVGCGTGATTRELAARVGSSGAVVGVDVSTLLLSLARERATAAVSFIEADAQTYAFEPSAFDGAFSRFGVMFFADPVAAFANVRTALRPGGRLAFVCWQAAAAQEWIRLPLEAAGLPADALDAEGAAPFSLAGADRLRGVLEDAGFGGVTLQDRAQTMLLGGRGGADEAVAFLAASRVGRFIVESRGPDALAAVRGDLAARGTGDGVALTAAVWVVSASND